MKKFKTTFYFEDEDSKKVFDKAVMDPESNKLFLISAEEKEEQEENEEK